MRLIWDRYEAGLPPTHVIVPDNTWNSTIRDWIPPAKDYVLDADDLKN
jgi:hypothetical protein